MAIQVLGEDGLPLTHLTQWDANRKLTIKGLPTFEQQPTLHYWDRDRYRAIVVPTTGDGGSGYTAQIPNILLQSSDDVVFTVFGRKPGVGGEAKAVFIHNVPVYEAKKPQDYAWEENIDYVEFTDLIKEAAALLLSLQQIGDHIEMTVDGMTVSATQLPEGQIPTVDKTINEDGTINIAFGIPKGDKGDKGDPGESAPQIDDTQASPDHPWSGQKVEEELEKAANSLIITIDIEQRQDGSFWTLPIDPADPPEKRPTSNDIINLVNAGKEVRLHFFDTVTNTGDQLYAYETTDKSVPYFRRNVVKSDRISRINIGVQYNGEVLFSDIPYNPPVQTCYATCTAEASPQQTAPVTWYVPKTMPRPSANPGMLIDVFWANGRADGLGYDVSLVWGSEGGADNETIVPSTSVTDSLTGEYSIPAEGTVRYQLEESNGRKHWRYVSGDVISKQFSSDTSAEIADKVVPGMSIAYLPGMEIYVQMDKGNTADLMRIVPAEGATLPVYGNGTGAKTGPIPAGYVLHLANAGDHWQIINGGNPDAVTYTPQSLTPEQMAQARENIGAQKAEGKWELIEEIKITEDTTRVSRTEEPDRTPYNFSAIMVEVNSAPNNIGERETDGRLFYADGDSRYFYLRKLQERPERYNKISITDYIINGLDVYSIEVGTASNINLKYSPENIKTDVTVGTFIKSGFDVSVRGRGLVAGDSVIIKAVRA